MTQADRLPGKFLVRHWQKKPFFAKAAIRSLAPVLDADELAWLALQDDVEARLVFTDTNNCGTTYRLESGPFSETQLAALPERNWTLLVQDIDKHLPDFRAHFTPFNCVPDWRIDDLMISVAAPGGSVGPHVDNYDVFLLQGHGNREWRLTDSDATAIDGATPGLSLLQPFAAKVSYDAVCGDVLYLPPGVPHWGIAKDLCTTYSIGLRAPTRAELLAGAARVFDQNNAPKQEDELVFYTDADLGADECEPGMIHPATLRRVRDQGLLDKSYDDAALATVFGSVVTDPKAWLMPEPLAELPTRLRVHGMARLAWFDNGAVRLAFANGVARQITTAGSRLVRELCRQRGRNDAVDLARLAERPDDGLLEWLRQEAVFDPSSDPE